MGYLINLYTYDFVYRRILIMTVAKKRWMIIFSSAGIILITCYMFIVPMHEVIRIDDTLLNISFKFLNVPSIPCTLADQFVILVHTSPSNIDKRKIIRSTWKQDADDNHIKVFFMVGTTSVAKTRIALEKEISKYNDFVQGNFDDSYHNLTYKHVMNFKYIISYCPAVKYLLKIDDDTFVHIAALKNFLDFYNWQQGNSSNLICQRRSGHPVLREGKWRVNETEYAGSTYPTHCLGFAVIYPRKTISLLYSVSKERKYFWIDDVFVTGILASAAGVNHTDFSPLILSKDRNVPFLFGGINMKVSEVKDLWNFTREHSTKYSLLDYLS